MDDRDGAALVKHRGDVARLLVFFAVCAVIGGGVALNMDAPTEPVPPGYQLETLSIGGE